MRRRPLRSSSPLTAPPRDRHHTRRPWPGQPVQTAGAWRPARGIDSFPHVPDLTSPYGPAVCIRLIVAAYWGRVLRLVYKSYKKTGRAANFWPVEPLGRALRVIWIPAVIGWIVIPLLIAA